MASTIDRFVGGGSGPDDEEEEEQPQQANMAELRAATDPMAGAEGFKQESTAQAGTVVDFLESTDETEQDVVASDSPNDGSDNTGVVKTPEGGAVVTTEGDGTPKSAGPGRDRLASLADDSSNDSSDGSDRASFIGSLRLPHRVSQGDPFIFKVWTKNKGPAGKTGAGSRRYDINVRGTSISASRTVQLGGGQVRTFTERGVASQTRNLSPGTYTVELKIGGDVEDTHTVTVGAGGGDSSSPSGEDPQSDTQGDQGNGDPFAGLTGPRTFGSSSSGRGTDSGGSGGFDSTLLILTVALLLGGGWYVTQGGD